ncbi:MAG: Plug domain-containing protein, partial [Bacteroidaceae bacterium]|nr:Plug domain-containing protein [Bacteroidaceae bacterium]
YLLLSSEVKGNIELPETYFKENTKESEQNLDLLMLTQGWRRYDISKLTQGSLKQPDTKPEIGQEIHGQVVSEYSGKPFEKAPVLMIIQGARFYEEKETDSLGRFSFTHLEFPDSTRYILRGLSHKNKSKDVLTKVQEDFFPKIYKPKGIYTLLNRPTVKKELDINVLNDSTIRLIELGEVEITASFKQPRVPSFGFVSRAYTTTLDEKFYKKKQVYDMVDLLNTTPFVTCMGDAIYVRYSPTMRKGSRMGLEAAAPPLMMIDDIRSDIYQVLSLNPEDIEEVSVVRKTLGTIYELEASSLLLIYTKPHIKRVDRFAKVNIAGHTPLGYQLPAEFYSPKYVAEVKGKNDNRHTLHWQPNVVISQDGKADFNFYTGDKTGNYTVVVQGVTTDGEIIHAKKQFKVVENEE